MIIVLVLGLGCLIIGTLAMGLCWMRPEGRVIEALENRNVHPHLWGFHVMAAGAVVSVLRHGLELTPWVDLSVPVRIVVLIPVVWGVSGLYLAAMAAFRPANSPVSLIPGPGTSHRAWPVLYRGFLVLGLIATALTALLLW